MIRRFLTTRVEASLPTVVLAIGDVTAIVVFVAIGELRHGGSIHAGLSTTLFFGTAWLVVAPLAGVYAARALTERRFGIWRVIIAWIGTVLVMHGVRYLITARLSIAPTFVLVAIAAGGGLLALWRVTAPLILDYLSV
jgi:hypothetical protein